MTNRHVADKGKGRADMGYFILRRGQQYGPYSQADLELYLSTGSISLSDLGRTEEMNEWLLLSEIVGDAPALPLSSAGKLSTPTSASSGSDGTSSNGNQLRPMPPPGPVPGNLSHSVAADMDLEGAVPLPPGGLHWALLLFLATISLGMFAVVWTFVQAIWVRKIDPPSRALLYLLFALVSNLAGLGLIFAHRYVMAWPILLMAIAFVFAGVFSMRASLECHYNTVETRRLRLSGIMTFFFSVFYFQFHLHRILQEKRAEELAEGPASREYAKPA